MHTFSRSGFILFALLAACGNSNKEAAPAQVPDAPGGAAPAAVPASPGTPRNATVVPNGQAKVGDKTKCPVMDNEFVVTEGSPKAEYEGKTYYFCCPGCIEQFKADPKKYLSKPKS